MFGSACVRVCRGGPHVRGDDSYTTLGENKHLKRPVQIHSRGSFINQPVLHSSTHSIPPLLHGITRWPGAAKNPLGAARRE